MENGSDAFALNRGNVASVGAIEDLSLFSSCLDKDEVAQIDDFEPECDTLELVYDDIGGAEPPVLELEVQENGDAEVYADGELIGVVHGGSVLTVGDIIVVPASQLD